MSSTTKLSSGDLQAIATYQKGIIVCIVVYLGAVVGSFFIPPEFRFVIGLGLLALGAISTVFVFLLSTKVYSPAIGILLAVLTLIPCIGLITLLIINQKATGLLTAHGIKVGLLGARMSDLKE